MEEELMSEELMERLLDEEMPVLKAKDITDKELRDCYEIHDITLAAVSLLSGSYGYYGGAPVSRGFRGNLAHLWNTIVDRVHDAWHVLRYGWLDDDH